MPSAAIQGSKQDAVAAALHERERRNERGGFAGIGDATRSPVPQVLASSAQKPDCPRSTRTRVSSIGVDCALAELGHGASEVHARRDWRRGAA